MMSPPAPLIVTAELPPELFATANALRKAHFPPERNKLDAHVTLFHALPPSAIDEAARLLAAMAGRHAPLGAMLSGVYSLGGGTALAIDCPPLLALRGELAEHFHGLLTAQDQGRPRLHITIQNKVTGAVAKALQQTLAANFEARPFRFHGLGLHHYRGGPWELAGRWSFRGKQGG